MRRMSGLLVERRGLVLLATAFISALAIAQLPRASFDSDISGVLLDGKRYRELAAHRERFDNGEPITVLVRLTGRERFTGKRALIALIAYRDALARVPGVGSVTSLVPALNPLTHEPITAETIESLPPWLISRLLGSGLAELFVDDSKQNTMLLVTPDRAADPIALVEALGEVEAPAGFDVRLAGTSVIISAMADALGWRVLAMPLLVLLFLLGTFYASLRSVKATLVAFLPAVLGTLWTFGLIFGLGWRLDVVTASVPLFVLVMGSADGLHLVTYLRAEGARAAEPVDRISRALERVGVPMVLTTVSTAIGFGSLLLTDIRPVRALGGFVACGIVFAGLISWFILPALLGYIDIGARARPNGAVAGSGRPRRWLRLLTSRRWPAALLGAFIAGAGALYIPRLAVDADPLFFFDDDDPIREGFDRMAEMFGGGTPLTGEFAYDPDAPAGPQLGRMRALERELERLPGVSRVFSLADVAPLLPERTVRALLRGEQVAGVGRLASGQSVLFVLLPDRYESANLRRWLAFADSHEEIIVLSGVSVLFDELGQRVLTGLMRSVLFAFVCIAFLLAVAYRSEWESMVALVPLTATAGALLAFVAVAEIQINLVTAAVAGVVIGVGVDYAIHLIAAIHFERPLGDGYVGRALEQTALPIAANALGIALSMSALWLSPIRPPGQIAAIMWVTMLAGALSALVIIPACYPRHALSAPAR